MPGHNLTEVGRAKLTNHFAATVIRCRWGGSVQQGLSAAGGALGFCSLGLAADKRYSLEHHSTGVADAKYP